jgi:hypothetical protein
VRKEIRRGFKVNVWLRRIPLERKRDEKKQQKHKEKRNNPRPHPLKIHRCTIKNNKAMGRYSMWWAKTEEKEIKREGRDLSPNCQVFAWIKPRIKGSRGSCPDQSVVIEQNAKCAYHALVLEKVHRT